MTEPSRRSTVCLVTTGHPSTNPRLVKEADALAGAGYPVRVVACKFWAWADRADAAFDDRPWAVSWVRFGEMASGPRRRWLALRRRVARAVAERYPGWDAAGVRALHYVTPELAREAAAIPADLYIAHNLGALPAAARAAARHGARLGFDAEDYHSGELPLAPAYDRERALVQAIEARYIPRCDYVTAASDGIAEAYARDLGIPRPTTILNVFPLAEQEAEVDTAALEAEKRPGTRSLYWFSQTIGPNRGLEDAVRALPLLPPDVHLYLRGSWAPGYERRLRSEAAALGVGERVHQLVPVPPSVLIRHTAEHDVGLALEQTHTPNRALCVTNKLFTYLTAGVPFAATDTVGQRGVCDDLPAPATRLFASHDATALATAVTSLLDDADARPAAREAAERFNWEVERDRFLSAVRAALATPAASRFPLLAS